MSLGINYIFIIVSPDHVKLKIFSKHHFVGFHEDRCSGREEVVGARALKLGQPPTTCTLQAT